MIDKNFIKKFKIYISEKYIDDDDDYDYDPFDDGYDDTFGEYKGDNIFYHGTTDKRLVGQNGIHVGTYDAAKQALEARIGVPAEGEWDGTRKYSETLLAGRHKIKQYEKKGIYCGTGYNCGNDVPNEDYLPTTRKEKAKYSDGTPIPLDSYPDILKVKIVGDMKSEIISDAKANDLGNNTYSSTGYYYKNIGEDGGSISAVVPNSKWLKILNQAIL